MTIAKDFAAKAAIAFVAVAMLFTMTVPSAKAQSSEDMQKMINDLLAQIAALQGSTGSTASAAGVCPFTWTRDLKTGATGADVKALQQFLNANADTRVAATGAGSAGMETETFGPATAAAVSKFQVMYRADVLTPAGLTNPTGFFGPGTRAKANALCVTSTTSPVDEEEEDEDTSTGALQGEGTLASEDLDDASDTDVMEGEEDAVIATLTLEAEDGDISVSRLDFSIVDAGGTANDEDIWDTLETVSVWVDGDMVGEFDASDEDNYLDENNGTFRISGIDVVVPEDEEVDFDIAVTVAGAVDGAAAASATTADWDLDVTDIRYFDADDVASTDSLAVTEIDFVVVEEGVDDLAEIVSDANTPEAATLKVDEDTTDSDEFDVHLFTIEVDKDSSDLEFNDMAMATVTVTGAGAGTSAGATADDVIEAVYMTIDGETVEGDHVSGRTSSIANSDVANVVYEFDFEGMTLESDTDYDAVISIVFKGQDGVYDNGVTVRTSVNGATWDLEGLTGDNELEDTDSSEIMTLATVVPEITGVEASVDRNEAGDAGTISFEFTVGAEDDDVVFAVADNANVATSSDEIDYTISPATGASSTAALTLVSGDATYAAGEWTVQDGDEATFVLDVTFTSASAAGTYRVNLATIGGVEVDETSAGLSI